MGRRVRRSRADNARWEQMVATLRLMNFAFNNIRLYPPTHSEVVTVLDKLTETLKPILEEQEDVGFGFMEELLYIEGSMSLEETASNQMLVDRFTRCRVKYLTLMRGVTREDFSVFFQILNAEAVKPTAVSPGDQLAAKNIATIHIVEADVDNQASRAKMSRKKTLLDWYEKAVATLGTVRDEFRTGNDADLKPLYHLVDDMTATMRGKGYEPYLLLPYVAKGLDPHLTHGVNVGVLSCALGRLYGLNSGQINTLCAAAFLHDLGRLTIPIDWTQDHAPLTPQDREVVRQHADWGFLLLGRHPEISPETAWLAAVHHDLPVPAPAAGGCGADVFHELLHLADAYDLALIGERYYWKQRRRDRVLKHLLNRQGRPYGPTLLKLLADCVGYYPAGSMVRLSDGQRGIVVRPNPCNAGRPKIFLFEAPGVQLPPAADGTPGDVQPAIVDLEELGEGGLDFRLSIVAVLDADPGMLGAALDAKKEYLLTHTL